ncbi:hypothetical protein C8F04DRAFT_1107129 [Mycena alexandri]|uniref:Uncharacterized protein n=1 Tax=Mycena alexandri TaxID=1745969 RepID=A0AAD6SRR4_9AGAR|nr:hypothetical protein C8F04DRAFT_1107129 [Mycena alexandri]
MATTSALPPTTHALPSTHRAHLIRSTRKLGNILGETPLLLDVYPSGPSHSRSSSVSSVASTDSKRTGRIFADAPRSSSLASADVAPVPSSDDSVSTNTKAKSMDAPRPLLVLRLASQRPLSSVSIVSPRSPAFSPITPTFVVDRRKKMAKLTRTLGANVPPELVFSAASDQRTSINSDSGLLMPLPGHQRSTSYNIPGRRGSYSSAGSSALASPTREAAFSSNTYHGGHTSGSPTSDGWVDLAQPSSYPPSPRSPHYAKTSPTWSASFADDMRVPVPTSPPARPSTTTRSTGDTRYLSRHFQFAPSSRSASPYPGSSRSSSPYRPADEADDEDEHGNTHRKEAGWSGEWSGAQGMDDVVNRLRGLKMK